RATARSLCAPPPTTSSRTPLHDALPILQEDREPSQRPQALHRSLDQARRPVTRRRREVTRELPAPAATSARRDALIGSATQPQKIGRAQRLNSSHQIISYAVFCLKKTID